MVGLHLKVRREMFIVAEIKKRVACLYRVSTERQVSSDDDLPIQREACKEFIEQHSDWIFEKEYLEKGVSGFKVSIDKREKLQEIKSDVLAKKFEILLVFMFDRLGRREYEIPLLTEWFVEQGIEVWSVKEGQQRFDTHADGLMNFFRSWIANEESRKTSMRVDNARKQFTKLGLYTGGKVPYGYQLMETGEVSKKGVPVKFPIIHEPEAEVVRLMFTLAVRNGYGIHRIAKYLNERGIPSKTGGQWAACTIAYLFRNPMYKGYITYGRTTAKGSSKNQKRTTPDNWVYSDPIPELAIISEDIWNEVQERKQEVVEEQKQQEQANLAIKDKHIRRGQLLLIGFIYCGYCGKRMVTGYTNYRWTTEDGEKHRTWEAVYKCGGKTSGQLGCTLRVSNYPKVVEGLVLEEIYKYFDKLATVDLSTEIEKLKKKNTSEDMKKQKEFETEAKKIQNDIQKLKGEVLKSLCGESSFSPELISSLLKEKEDQLSSIKSQLEQLTLELEKKQLELSDYENLQQLIPVWKDEFAKADRDTQKVLLSKIIERVVVFNDKIQVRLKVGIEDFFERGAREEASIGINGFADIHILGGFFLIPKMHQYFISDSDAIQTDCVRKAHKNGKEGIAFLEGRL